MKQQISLIDFHIFLLSTSPTLLNRDDSKGDQANIGNKWNHKAAVYFKEN